MGGEAVGTISLVALKLLGIYFYNAPTLLENEFKPIKFIQCVHNLNTDVV